MAIKTHATIHNVKGGQLPLEWANALGLDAKKESDLLVDVTLRLTSDQQKKKAPYKQIMETVKRLQNTPVINPDFNEVDLYDDEGLITRQDVS